MNETINKFLLVGEMKSGNTDFIYKNELDKACSQHDMVNQEI